MPSDYVRATGGHAAHATAKNYAEALSAAFGTASRIETHSPYDAAIHDNRATRTEPREQSYSDLQPQPPLFVGKSLQHSLLSDFAAGFAEADCFACSAGTIAAFSGSDLAEPPQHELDMINLQKRDTSLPKVTSLSSPAGLRPCCIGA